MRTAERFSAIAAEYQQARLAARRNFPSAGVGRSSGRRRDQAEARARRIYKAKLSKVAPRAALRAR